MERVGVGRTCLEYCHSGNDIVNRWRAFPPLHHMTCTRLSWEGTASRVHAICVQAREEAFQLL